MHDDNRMAEKEILASARRRLDAILPREASRWLLVDVSRQRLLRIEGGRVLQTYRVSTAGAGVDARQGSRGTPPGVHRVSGRIGGGLPSGTRFESREPLPDPWTPDTEPADAADESPDLILSRILTLRGCEPGINSGPGVDSEARYIYIHGTNHEAEIGKPVSGGCIRMTNADIIRLFEEVEEGDPVVIV